MHPQVSVIMAVFNGEKWLPTSVQSVLNQDFIDFEFIIIDDASDDDTVLWLKTLNDPRIILKQNKTNLGQTASLNIALNLSKAPFVARIDADDFWAPGKLSRQVAFLHQNPEIAVVGTWATRIDIHGRSLGVSRLPVTHTEVIARLLRGVPVCHVSVLMRRDAINAVSGYPEHYRFAADYALWSSLMRAGSIITNIPEYLTYYVEDPTTFGASQKIGLAGREVAEIIRLNADFFSNIELTIEQSQEIALMLFPLSGLSECSIVNSYCCLRKVQFSAVKNWSFSLDLELWSVFLWALTKHWSHAKINEKAWVRRWAILVFKNFSNWYVFSAIIISGACAFLDFGSLKKIKGQLLKISLVLRSWC